jgi:hypothetical protein
MVATLQLSEVAAKAGGNATLQISSLTAQTGGQATLQISEIKANAGAPPGFSVVAVAPTQPQFNPFEVVDLTASSALAPDTWLWAQTAGTPALTIANPAAGTTTVKLPGLFVQTTFTFRVTVTKAGYPAASDSVNVTVIPHAGHFGPAPNYRGWELH